MQLGMGHVAKASQQAMLWSASVLLATASSKFVEKAVLLLNSFNKVVWWLLVGGPSLPGSCLQ